MDRSKRSSGEVPPTNPNVFDDEYALDNDGDDFMPGVVDGFRPMGGREELDGNRQDHNRNDAPRPLFTTQRSQETDLRRVATRNSTAKVPCARESVSLDDRTHPQGPSSQTTTLQHRESVSSTASFATMARSDSPLPTGPSHPYGMYSQNTMARTTSSATAPSPLAAPLPSLQGPMHPYGMYPQNTIEDPAPLPPVQAGIPLGFPGLPAGYHRRIGPDGEEQDIIGPDGHTEQLPPYTRFPAEGPTKAALAAEASASPVDPTVAPIAPIAQISHIAVPMNSSNDTLISPISPTSSISSLSPTPSIAPALPPTQSQEEQRPSTAVAMLASPSEQRVSEKQDSAKSLKTTNWRSRKLWGRLPMGVALILLVLVLIFAVILGAAIGTFVAKNKGQNHKDNNNNNNKDKNRDGPAPQITGGPTLFDATPITTPTSLPVLPTGSYSLPLGMAQESNPSCLTLANQLSAWSCKMVFTPLVLTVNTSLSMPPTASLAAFAKADGGIQYGLQPPQINIEPMQLVLDLDYKMYGPAFHFAAMYDKVVVLRPDEFAAGSSLRKRQGDKPPFRHRFQVMPGENPWFCIWNHTYIEGYIYVQDNSTAAPFPTAFPTNDFGPSNTAETSLPTSAAPTPTTSTQKPRRRGDNDYPRLPLYPRIVKVEERRLPGAPQPYCQKMLLLENGKMTPALSNSGNAITIALQEQDPDLDAFLGRSGPPHPSSNGTNRRRQLGQKRTDPTGACHCQWMFQ